MCVLIVANAIPLYKITDMTGGYSAQWIGIARTSRGTGTKPAA